MESNNLNQISIDIPNYSGPLEVLLDLAKTQKVDLAEISITKLANKFLEYIKENENLNLETASEYLLMATWLAYLKSKFEFRDCIRVFINGYLVSIFKVKIASSRR